MKEIISDPSTLTKAKLKEELKRHNIKLPPSSAKKQAYVDLYLAHISEEVDVDEEVDEQTESGEDEVKHTDSETEYSEEESESVNNSAINIQPQASEIPEKQVPTQENQTAMANVPVTTMSNEELAEELRSLGFVPGPILESTRKVYEKKLIKLRQSAGGDAINEVPSTTHYEEVPDDDAYDPPPREPVRQRITRRTPARKTEDEEPETRTADYKSTSTQQTTSSRQTSSQQTSQPASTQQTKAKSGIPLWVKLLVLLGVIFFIYLVIVNMDPSSDSKLPKSIGDDSNV